MPGVRVNQVFNNYENLKHYLLLNIDALLVEKFKTRCKISRRRLDFITNISVLITILEKLGDLDAFNIQPVETMCGVLTEGTVKKELQNFIRMHNILISKCDNAVIPVRNQYAEEILNRRLENDRNNLGTNNENSLRRQENFTVNQSTLRRQENITSNDESPCRGHENIQINRGNNIECHTDISDQFREVIEFISEEIGNKWQDLARYLGLKDVEVEEILYDLNCRGLKDKARKSLSMALRRRNPEAVPTAILEALSRARRNDLKKRVQSMM